jgi:hypothetical protein
MDFGFFEEEKSSTDLGASFECRLKLNGAKTVIGMPF